MKAIEAKNLVRHYGDQVAVDGISFSVEEGEIFGLIGPDGAGKTSIFRMLTTVLLPDSGEATVVGYDVVKDYRKIRSLAGYMPGKFSLYQDLTVEENLQFFAAVFNVGVEENYNLIRDIYIQIEPFKNRRAGKLSGGMKQKLALCCALIHKPSVLFLDEPTTGVDPVSRRELWEMLKRLKKDGITIIVATPYMDEAAMCDRIALIQKGKILTVDAPEKISASFNGQIYAVKAGNMPALLHVLKELESIRQYYSFGEFAHVVTGNEQSYAEAIKKFLIEKGFTNAEVVPVDATIEDSFISLLK